MANSKEYAPARLISTVMYKLLLLLKVKSCGRPEILLQEPLISHLQDHWIWFVSGTIFLAVQDRSVNVVLSAPALATGGWFTATGGGFGCFIFAATQRIIKLL
ncbi:MAG: hypothetical protein WKF59_21495 [Chitinophagaceae bacterium]